MNKLIVGKRYKIKDDFNIRDFNKDFIFPLIEGRSSICTYFSGDEKTCRIMFKGHSTKNRDNWYHSSGLDMFEEIKEFIQEEFDL